MTYVPTPPPDSPLVRELSRRLAETIAQFRRERPGVSSREIRRAAQLAARSSTGAEPRALIVAVGALVAGGLALFLFAQRGRVEDGSSVWIAAVVVGIALIALAAKRLR